jgi:hypothetical protein
MPIRTRTSRPLVAIAAYLLALTLIGLAQAAGAMIAITLA